MRILLLTVVLLLPELVCKGQEPTSQSTLRVLFIGNSYTGRHRLTDVVKALAEEGSPGLTLEPTSVIYGGRRLVDHWRLGTQHIVNQHAVTRQQIQSTIDDLVETLRATPSDRYAKSAIARQKALLKDLSNSRDRWDVVVLQSYRDDLTGADSLYMKYAPRFAQLARAQGAKVILYETTPTTQNAEPLAAPPDRAPVIDKARAIAALAKRIDAKVAPMSLVAMRCQTQRPDLTLRFINDAHLNQTMAYLTACTIYAALFERSPEGLTVDSVTDIRYWQNKDRERDRDNKPITRTFNANDRGDLQRIAWQAYQEFQTLQD